MHFQRAGGGLSDLGRTLDMAGTWLKHVGIALMNYLVRNFAAAGHSTRSTT